MTDSIAIPKEVFGDLDLHEGDVVEGRTQASSVEIRVVRRGQRQPGDGITADQFVKKWQGAFPGTDDGDDPRLRALLNKHVKPA